MKTHRQPLINLPWEPCLTSMMKRFAKTVNDFQQLAIFAKRSIIDVWQGSEYASNSKV